MKGQKGEAVVSQFKNTFHCSGEECFYKEDSSGGNETGN